MLKTLRSKYPAAITVIPFACGIALSYFTKINLSVIPSLYFLIILITLGASVIFLYPTLKKGELFLFTYVTILLFFGLFSFQYRYHVVDAGNVSRHITELEKNSIQLNGVITERPEVKDDRTRLVLSVTSVDSMAVNGNVITSIYKNRFKEDVKNELKYGDVISLTGKLENLPHRRNPGEFDYGEYLKLHDIDAMFIGFGYDKIEVIGHDIPGIFKGKVIIPVKEYSIRIIDELIGGEEGEYLKGLVLGERSNISKEMKENFVNAGVAHIIAVSGLNVAYVIIIVWGLLIFIPVRYSVKVSIILLFLFFYMNLTGNTPSIVRASLMASVFILAQVIERKPNAYNIVSFSALVILLWDPRQLYDPGFILSYSAIFSIIIIYPVFERWMNLIKWYRELDHDKLKGKIIKGIITLFLGTLAAQAGTLPVTAIMFKKISIISLVANLFAIPLSNIALALGFIMIIFSTFSLWLASLFAGLNAFLLYWQLLLIEFCAKLDYSFVETYFVDWMLFAFYYVVLLLMLTMHKANYKARLIIAVLLISNFILFRSIIERTDLSQITYMDTGNSNSTLITLPAGTSVLINAGTSSASFTSAERNIIPYLKTKGISSLDLLIVQSLNAKEYISLQHLVNNFPVNRIVIPAYYKPMIEKNLKRRGAPANIEYINSSKIINQKGAFRLYIYYDSLYSGPSMMTDFVCGNDHFLFNDGRSVEDNFINSQYIRGNSGYKVLRVPAGGSFDNTSTEFLVNSDPQNIIISSSRTGRKKKNSEIFSQTLDGSGFKVFKTGERGAVIFETNGVETRMIDW